MKQSTFSAVMATNLLNVLQGYTKSIRFVAVLLVLFTVNIGTASAEKSIDFESGTATYSDWTFTNMTSKQSGSITAKGGSYYGTTGAKSTASIQTKNQISSPKSISCYVSKQSTNTTSSTWYIQTSTNGSSWTDVKTQSATSMSKGTWVEFTADLSSYSNVYVRIYYSGSTAVRNIDNLVLTEGTTTSYDVNWMVNGETYTTGSPTTSVPEGNKVTILPTAPTLDCSGKTFVGWSNQEVTDGNKPSVLFTTAENSPAINADATFYAVFATATGSGSTTDTYDWESTSTGNWTVDDITRTASQGVSSSYAGQISTANTYVTYTKKVAVTEFSFQFKRTSNNNNYNVYIETSTDNSNWSAAATYAMSSFGNGSYTSKSKTFDGNTELYVRFHCHNTTAVRYVDNVSITYSSSSYSDYTTTCGPSCTAPTSVTVTPTDENGWRYSIGETISLKATAEGGSGDYTYQWQKYIESAWEDIDGATSQVYTKTDCGTGDSGTYRCVVSTGDGCSTESNEYWVRVFTLAGNFNSNSEWNDEKIIWSTEDNQHTIGTVTLTLPANATYEFKVADNDGRWFGNPGIINATTDWWGFGVDDDNCTLQTKQAGEYIFTIDVEHAGDSEGTYVNVKVTFPTTQIIYFKPATSGTWADDAKFTIYSWGSGDPSYTPLEDKDCGGIYSAEISTTHTSLLFIKASTYKENFDDITAQTIDLTAPIGDKMLFDMSKLYLTPNSNWKQGNAWFAAYFYGNGETWRKMTDSDGDGIYECEKVSGYPNVIFCRMNPATTALDWDSKWNQTGDLAIPTNHNTHNFVVPSGAWDGSTTGWSETGTWTTYIPNHTVTFDANGHGTEPKDQCITDGKTASQPTAPTATGYTFGGWYEEAGCTNAWDFENDVVTEDITLYAKWTINTHTLTWNVNDGNALTGTYTSGSVAYGTVIVPPATPTRTGHTFLGWKETDGSTTIAETMPDKDLTYTAQWQICLYTLTWHLNGGTVTTAGTHAAEGATGSPYGGVEYGASITAPIVEREGYRFDGWHDGKAFVEPATTMSTTDLTYTAQWTKLHTITWNAAGETSTTTVVDGEHVKLPSAPSSCSDTYTTFVGWYTAASGMETSPSATPQGEQVTTSTIPTGNATYYAVWADGSGAGGEQISATLDFSTNSWDFPTGYTTTEQTYTDGNYSIKLAGTGDGYKYNNNQILLGKSGAYMELPAFPFKVSKIVAVEPSATVSGKVTWNVYSGENAVSTEVTGCTTGGTFEINENYQAIGTIYTIKVTNANNLQVKTLDIYEFVSGATGYISSCCQSQAVVTVEPANANLELNIDGTASTTVRISQTGGGNGKYYEPTVSPADGASHNWDDFDVTYKTTAYNIDFTATKEGTYTVTGNFTETTAGCPKYGSATITVVANPILLASANELTFSPTCGQNSVSQEVEINSRYLTSNSITATVATTDGNGQFTISTDNTTFGTSKTLSGGTTTKVTDQIYVRYEAEEGEIGAVAGTLTLKCGSTQQVINLTGTCTCSANVTITGDPIQITAAEGVWVEAATELTVTGTFLTTNADNANVSIRAYTNNAAFQIKKGGVTGEGAPKTASNNALTLNTDGAISTADWTGNIGVVYKPTQANTTETATLTVEVYRYNGSAIYSTATYELEGRSLPEQFVIAVTNGSDDWFAVPADMIAPWGDACSGLGTFAPYPISVDNATAPTEASNVPARAVYQAAARTGNVNTNPQTMSYKSVPLGGNYYLYGSSTSVDSDGNNTNIQNASFEASEKQKWFLDVVDWNTKQYNMHVHSSLTTNVLAYTTAGGTNRVGQYSASAGTTKKSIYLLPINGTTCTYYAAPVVTVTAIDATNATIQFKNDRTTAYEISLDQNTWTDLPVTLIKDCNNSEEATQLQAQLLLDTYRGQTVYIRAKVTTGTACQETGSFVVPNPTIDRGESPWKYTGTAGQAFSDNSKSITISDLWNPLSVSVAEQRTNSNIQASITPEGVVTVSMAAEDATEGVHEAILQFISDGASFVDNGKGNPQYVGVQITLHSLAEMNFDGGNGAFDNVNGTIMLCKEAIDGGITPKIYLNDALCLNGNYISTTEELNQTTFSLVDLNSGASLSFERDGTNGGYGGGIASVTFNASTIAAMIPGHTYRLSWENTNQVMTNKDGLPYMDCYMDFVYSENCDAPTALAACPITQTSFTANWAPVADCTGDVTVDVYTKQNAVLQEYNFTTSGSTAINAWSQRGPTKWFIGGTGVQSKTTNGYKMLSTDGGYNVYSPQLSNWKNDITTNDEVKITLVGYNNRTDATTYTLKLYVVENANMPTSAGRPSTFKTVTINGQSTNVYNLTLAAGQVSSTGVFTIKGLSATDRFFITSSSSSSNCLLTSIKMESSAKTPVDTKTISCNVGSAEFTGLSDNTTYYYTVTDGSGNTSNEIAVTTYNGEPELKFYSDEACTTEITETTVLGGEETTVYVKGTHVPACDINASVSTGYGMDDSGINYTTGTGAVSGSIILTLTDANTTEGTLTITDAEGNDYVLNIVSSDCPAGFGTMALPATNITNESAQANWRNTLDFGDDKSGTLQLYKNGIVNRELIVNGDFETGSLDAGWSNGINKGVADAAHSFGQYAIKNSQSEAHAGNYSLYVTAKGGTLTNFHGQSVMYADYITLTPGTYRMSAWVKMPMADGRNDKTQLFSLGIITGENGSEHVYTVSTPVTVYSNNTYVQLTHEFEVTSTITKACPAIGASSGTFRYFYLDDVSLVCTSIGQSDEPYLSIDIADLSAAGNLALTDLSGNTEYTYVIQNADGCSSNPITFQTTEAGAPVITPNDVAITCQVGNSTNGIMTLTVKDVYSDIYISNSCTERITLNTTQLPKEGGVVNFTFTPLNTDQGGETGTCTISFTTKGMSTPAEGVITWTVTAGVDPDLPIIDVTDITNTSLNIEHNVEGDGVQIVISRERQEDEIEDNIGEEIFFSKYYEAYMHKKLWAIYNPTKEKISLANTYVWRSNGKGTDWNIEGGLDLSQMGNIESGYIYPNEELIVYTSDQVGECEQSKADMTNWVAMSSSDPALSFSGNDALLLVRKNIDGDADNPPTESVELDSNGDPYELSWRQYPDAEGNSWWMLDIIGARQNNNKPDISATGSWTWECNGKTEKGDAAGWYGDQGEHLNATLYKDCGYVLSTNRCLLIRKESVKSGYKAIKENIGDMFTLGKNDYPTEWRGAHVPQDGNQEETSCENFTYVGGYDYESYYNAWTDLDNLQPAVQQPDGSWLVEGVDVPNFYCHPLLIEVLITDVVNGEEVENVSAYLEYKVPIVVDEDVTTNDTRYFVEPTPENVLSPEICAECDVVIRDGAKLTHIEDGRAEFRTMQVYPTAKFEIPAGLNMQLEGLHMYAKNDEVGYAIINNDGSSIHAEDIIHIKRIDDMYWYPFSLPYDCKVSSIYQINGKSMGEYWVDWGIKYYDGEARQQEGDNYAGGATSKFWKKLDASETLKAHQGYIIGLFTTEWQGQMKSIYFPPVENTEYTEGGNDAKTTYISNWSDNLTCEPRHRGWNFTGLPYISLFSSQNGDGTTNNNSLMMGSQTDDYATSSIVYVSIPDGGDSRTYTQVSAASVKLEPFKPYFVQAMDPTDGQSHDDIALTYSKGGRTLDKIQARSAASTQATIIVELVVTNADATLTDNAGVLANDRYTENYEIAADLMKMYAEDRKPQLFTRAANNEMMAYNALPDCLAQNIPLGLFVPEAGEYTISILEDASQLADAEAAYLLYEGEIVTNLLCSDYTVMASQRGLIDGYSLDIRRKQNTTTNINNLTDGAPVITIVDGQIVIQQLPDNAEVQIIDVLGRVLYQQANVPHIITFQAPATGVYNVVITTTEQQFTHKTIIR